MHKTLVVPARFKALTKTDGEATGQVEALVSVFDNIDVVNDRVKHGAFDELVDRVKAGERPPWVWSHQTHSPEMFIGDIIDAEQQAEGLWLKAQHHMDEPLAAKVFRLIKSGQIDQYSFSYDIVEARDVTENGERVQELVKLITHEAGPTMFGANPETQTIDAKGMTGAKAGRTLSKANEEKLRSAVADITGVLDQLDDTDDGKSNQSAETKGSEDPNGGKAHDAEDLPKGKDATDGDAEAISTWAELNRQAL